VEKGDFGMRKGSAAAAVPNTALETSQIKNGKRKTKFRLKLVNVVVYIAICATLVAILTSYMKLTELTADVTSQQKELTQLQNEGEGWQAKLDQMTSLKNVEEYARNTLGMTTMQQHQIEYLEPNGDTKVEITQPESGNILTSLSVAISKTFNAVMEYIS
jgi:cell division protein FtsB